MNKQSKWFKENGSLSEKGESGICVFSDALEEVFSNYDVNQMSEQELHILFSNLQHKLGNIFANKMTEKRNKPQVPNYLANMADDEFEGYLKNKYGKNWALRTLTPEELARTELLASQQKIKEILEKSVEKLRNVRNTLRPKLRKPRIPFKY